MASGLAALVLSPSQTPPVTLRPSQARSGLAQQGRGKPQGVQQALPGLGLRGLAQEQAVCSSQQQALGGKEGRR